MFRKEDTMTIVFSDEKMFDLDGIYNSENGRIWTVNREEANQRGGERTARKVSTKSYDMVSRMLRQGATPLVLFEKSTLDQCQGSTACFSTIRKQ